MRNINYERKKTVSDFGIEVKLELMVRNKTQNWLIEEVKKLNPTNHLLRDDYIKYGRSLQLKEVRKLYGKANF